MMAFAEAFRSGKYDRDAGRLSHWLFGIAYRRAARERPRRARPERLMSDRGEEGFWDGVPDDKAAFVVWVTEWQKLILGACMDQVRREFEPGTVEAFERLARDGQSAAEAAAALGVAVKTVYNAKHRVLKRIRELREELEAVDAISPGSS
jgi:RNA polymerase sigma-70 factor (ECF subfamily)